MRFKSILLTFVFALLISAMAFATNPTVTVTKVATYDHCTVYKWTCTTASANLDTLVIYKDITNSTPWFIGYMGFEGHTALADSFITHHVETTETTADSVRHKALYQVSYAATPTTSTVVNDDWVTLQSTTSDSAVSLIDRFSPFQVAHPLWFRILYIETASTKDAAQTLTGYIVFPKP